MIDQEIERLSNMAKNIPDAFKSGVWDVSLVEPSKMFFYLYGEKIELDSTEIFCLIKNKYCEFLVGYFVNYDKYDCNNSYQGSYFFNFVTSQKGSIEYSDNKFIRSQSRSLLSRDLTIFKVMGHKKNLFGIKQFLKDVAYDLNNFEKIKEKLKTLNGLEKLVDLKNKDNILYNFKKENFNRPFYFLDENNLLSNEILNNLNTSFHDELESIELAQKYLLSKNLNY